MKLYNKTKDWVKDLPRKKEILKEYYNHDPKNFAKDFSACFLGAVLPYAPLYAFYESVLPKIAENAPPIVHSLLPDMGNEKSALLKLIFLPLVGSFAYLVDKGKLFGRSKTNSLWLSDSLYYYGNSLTNIIPYTLGFGLDKIKKAAFLTLGSGPISTLTGLVDSSVTDVIKNLLDFEPNTAAIPFFKISKRLPKFIEKKSQNFKYGLIGLMIGASAIGTVGSYSYSGGLNNKSKSENNITISSDQFRSFREFNSLPSDGTKTINNLESLLNKDKK